MMKLGTVIYTLGQEDPKIYESLNAPIELYWHQHFSPKIDIFFVISGIKNKNCILFCELWFF